MILHTDSATLKNLALPLFKGCLLKCKLWQMETTPDFCEILNIVLTYQVIERIFHLHWSSRLEYLDRPLLPGTWRVCPYFYASLAEMGNTSISSQKYWYVLYKFLPNTIKVRRTLRIIIYWFWFFLFNSAEIRR